MESIITSKDIIFAILRFFEFGGYLMIYIGLDKVLKNYGSRPKAIKNPVVLPSNCDHLDTVSVRRSDEEGGIYYENTCKTCKKSFIHVPIKRKKKIRTALSTSK